jgi:hypothetical protein
LETISDACNEFRIRGGREDIPETRSNDSVDEKAAIEAGDSLEICDLTEKRTVEFCCVAQEAIWENLFEKNGIAVSVGQWQISQLRL